MANHKSALKRAKQNEIKQLRNKAVRTRIKNAVKQVNAALEAGAAPDAKAILDKAKAIIDKGAAKGVIHKNTASRKISRLARKVAALGS